MTAPEVITFTLFGEPASKANSRKIVTIGKGDNASAAVIKSDKALSYVRYAEQQMQPQWLAMLEGPVFVTMQIFYATERPDLDESVILDILQAQWRRNKVTKAREMVRRGVYVNDRQVRGKYITHHIDRDNPRAEITVEAMPAPEKPAKKTRRKASPADQLALIPA